MRTLLAIGIGIWAMSARAEVPPQQDVTLTWDYANPAGFIFYLKDTTGLVTNVVGVVTNATSLTLSNVIAGPHHYSVTASNMWGESDPSVPFITPQKPVTPSNLKPVSTMFKVTPPASFETTTDLVNWRERFRLFKPDSNGVQIVSQTVRPDNPFAFYRIRTTPTPVLPQ